MILDLPDREGTGNGAPGRQSGLMRRIGRDRIAGRRWAFSRRASPAGLQTVSGVARDAAGPSITAQEAAVGLIAASVQRRIRPQWSRQCSKRS
jgi:hypothetical protein